MFFGRVKQLVDANVGKQAPQSRDRVYMEVLQHWCIARDAANQLQGRTSLLMVSGVPHVTYDVIKHILNVTNRARIDTACTHL